MKITTILLLFWLLLIFSGCQKVNVDQSTKAVSTVKTPSGSEVTTSSTTKVQPSATTVDPVLPQPVPVKPMPTQALVVDYPVPFVSQAPYGVWDAFHEETCEEASMIMAAAFFQKKTLSVHDMEQGLLDIVSWEERNGYNIDISASQVVEILSQYFKQPAEIMADVSSDAIISQLDQGNVLIVPAAGRRLGNPFYTPPGPLYHMLVIRGYDRSTYEFITNDPGTKRGQAYRYSYDQLLSAVADWDSQQVDGGINQSVIPARQKKLVVVKNF